MIALAIKPSLPNLSYKIGLWWWILSFTTPQNEIKLKAYECRLEMKIKKPTTKRLHPLPQSLRGFIERVSASSEDELPALLKTFSWEGPKIDLAHWVPLLNKFDDILESEVEKYELKRGIQRIPLAQNDLLLLQSILVFERNLLDVSTNRSIYASGPLLNDLLHTTNIDILFAVLSIALRIAQRLNTHLSSRNLFPFSQERVLKFSGWYAPDDSLCDIAEFSSPDFIPNESYRTAKIEYYKTTTGYVGNSVISVSVNELNNGFEQALAKVLKDLPLEFHLEMMWRARWAVDSSTVEGRQKIIAVRTRAISTYGGVLQNVLLILAWLSNSHSLQSRFFSTPQISLPRFADICHPNRNTPLWLCSVIFNCLGAIAHNREHSHEVLTSLAASVNHGILLIIIRSAKNDLINGQTDMDYLQSLFTLILYLSTLQHGGHMLVSAGIIPILLDVCNIENEGSLKSVSKAVGLLDSLVYSISSAFNAFMNEKGIDVLVARVQKEVEYDLSINGDQCREDSKALIPYSRVLVLKSILKCIQRMMSTTGTSGGLRNLIESPLLASLKTILMDPDRFGGVIFASAMNIMTTFLHNEPTSFTIIQESDVPRILLLSISQNIRPSPDLLNAIPSAFGAICLNTVGLDMLKQADVIRAYFKIFLERPHVQVLMEKELDFVINLGGTFDELARHQPSLKDQINEQVILTTMKIVMMCHQPEYESQAKVTDVDGDPVVSESGHKEERQSIEDHITVWGKFLEGYLANFSNAKEFIKLEGVQNLVNIYSSPAIGHQFSNTSAARALQCVWKTLGENGSHTTIIVEALVAKLNSIGEKFLPHIALDLDILLASEMSGMNEVDRQYYLSTSNNVIRQLSWCAANVAVLTEFLETPPFGHGRSHQSLIQSFVSVKGHKELISLLGTLYRGCIRLDIMLTNDLSPALVEASNPVAALGENSEDDDANNQIERNLASFKNLSMLRSSISALLLASMSFFRSLAKSLVPKRSLDSLQKQRSIEVSESIAEVLSQNLVWDRIAALGGKKPLLTYWKFMLDFLSFVTLDEKSSQSSMHTFVVWSAYRNGCFHEIIVTLRHLWDMFKDRHFSSIEDEECQELLIDTTKTTLQYLTKVITAKVLTEAPQTTSLTTRTRDASNEDYFNAGAFLVYLRALVAPVVLHIWTVEGIKIPFLVAKSITETLSILLKAEGEPSRSMFDSLPLRRKYSKIDGIESPVENARQSDDIHATLATIPGSFKQNEVPNFATSRDSSSHDILENLNSERTKLRENLLPKALDILQSHKEAVFEISKLLQAGNPKNLEDHYFENIATKLVGFLLSPAEEYADDAKLDWKSSHARLLALLMQESDIFTTMLPYIRENIDGLIGNINHENIRDPVWIPSLLAIIEKVAVAGEESIDRIKPNEESDPGPLSFETKKQILKQIHEAAGSTLKGEDDRSALSALRLLAILSRDKSFANEMMIQSTMSSFFDLIRHFSAKNIDQCKAMLMVMLRHCIEDAENLSAIFTFTIKSFLGSTKGRSLEINSFVRSNAAFAIREPRLFIQTTTNLCKLHRYDPNRGSPQLVLKEEGDAAIPVEVKDRTIAQTNQMDMTPSMRVGSSSIGLSSPRTADKTIHFLMNEILKYRNEDTLPDEGQNKGELTDSSMDIDMTTSVSQARVQNEIFNYPERHQSHLYRIFLLQGLTELVGSYMQCKGDFLGLSRRSGSKEITTPSRPRSMFLNHLLNDLIPVKVPVQNSSGGVHLNESQLGEMLKQNVEAEKSSSTSYAASNLVAALCSSSGEAMDSNADMTSIRKFTLDSMLKTLKDAILSTEPLETRFSRYSAISNLCQNFTDTKPHMGSSTTAQEQLRRKDFQETSRIMYEKNFVTALTTALSTVDLNHPNARKVIKDLLRPISSLSKAGLNLGEIEPIAKSEASNAELAHSSDSEIDHVREDTPDLYRNSALGMFEGEVHEESEEDYEDEDELYDEMEMDYEDEGPTGSEQSDDEDARENGDMEVEVVLDNEINRESGDDEATTEDDSVSEDGDEMASHSYEEEFSEEGPIEDRDDNWLSASDAEENLVDDREVLEEIVQTLEASMEPEDMDQDRVLAGEEQELDEDEEGESDGDNDVEEEDVEEIIEDIIDSDEESEHLQLPWGQSFSNRMSRDHDFVQVISSSSRPRGNPWGMSPGHGHARSHHEFDNAMPSGRESPYTNGYMDASVNPILVPSTSVVPLEPVTSLRQERPSRPTIQNSWVQSLEMAMSVPPTGGSGSAISIISNLINQISRQGNIPGHAVRLEVNRGPGRHGQEVLSNQYDRIFQERHTSPSAKSAKGEFFDKFGTFSSSFTFQRWQDESRLLYGSNYIEKAQKHVESILSILIPPALAEQKSRREEEQKESEEKARRSEEDRKVTEEQQRLVKETEEAKRREREEIQREEDARNVAAPDPQPDEGAEMQDVRRQGEEVIGGGQDHGVDRQIVTMRGRAIDVTELAIDPDFLMALPDDMREEVFTQHIRELRANPQSNGESSEISPEFLQALPEDIRLELLQQEAIDRRRREREVQRNEAESTPGQASGPADIDFASFLATLDPELRQTVMAEQDDDSLAHLPPNFASEANSLRARGSFLTPISSRTALRPGQSLNSTSNRTKKTSRRDVAQMVDKAGVASIVRLIFIPRGSPSRSILSDCFLNICQNKTTRAEALNLLLTVLQEGTSDDVSANNMLSQLTMRARQITSTPAKPATNSTSKNKKPKDVIISSSLNHISSASVAQQTLMTLALLVENNEHLPSFFLNEHESYNTTLRKSGSRRGKSKEIGQSKSSKYPINTLLEMLERDSIRQNPAIIDVFAPLLSEVTRPLLILLKDDHPEVSAMGVAKVISQSKENHQEQEEEEDNSQAKEEKTIATSDGIRKDTSSGRRRLLSPPSIPESNLRLVLRILTADECSSRAFQRTVASMQHLCAIPNSTAIFADEFSSQAQIFGQHILKDLSQLAQQIAADEAENNELAKFSAASSDQAKLLRVLKAMDYLFDSKRLTRPKGRPEQPGVSEDISLRTLNENLSFGSLWRKLSECLTIIHENGNKLHIATALLPLIEALMVMCKNLKDSNPRNRYVMTPKTESPPPESMETLFFQFTEDHKKILNQMVRNNPNLMSGSFAELVNNPKVLDFDNKRNYLSRKLHGRGNNREVQQPLPLTVRREQVFLDSYKSLYFKSAEEITNAKFAIRFTGEEGVDAGGVTREWYQVLARQMFDPNYALFTPVASDSSTFHPNKTSYINSEHLSFFKFIGRIIGKSLFDGRVLDCHFSRAVYKSILGRSVSLKDMETLDLEFYKSLLWILEHNITNALFETFSINTEEFGDKKTIDLIPNGRNIAVTEENKQDFVRLTTEYRLVKSVEEQLQSFLKGFHDIIPPDLIAVFDEQELELLISGLPDIDVDDWRNNTEYHNYQTSSSQIQWLWRAVRSFDPEEKAKLLQFVTGTSQVPLNGFKDLVGMNGLQKFNIHRYHEGQDRLPVSHTCFNQLDLPEYESYEQLRSFLLIAINEGAEGFGMA